MSMTTRRQSLGTAFGAAALLLAAQPVAAAGKRHHFGARIYSDLSFVAGEGESVGYELIILPRGDGVQIVWRLAQGAMQEAALLQATPDAPNRYLVTVPMGTGSEPQQWTLTEKGGYLLGKTTTGITFKLKRIAG